MSSAYLRLLIFLQALLIPACASSSPAFLIMYSAYKLNKQGDNIQSWRTPFPIWNQSVVPCPVLTVASWPSYRFLKRQVRWSDIPNFRNFPQIIVIHTVQGFGIVSKAEINVFLELSCFFDNPELHIFYFALLFFGAYTLILLSYCGLNILSLHNEPFCYWLFCILWNILSLIYQYRLFCLLLAIWTFFINILFHLYLSLHFK